MTRRSAGIILSLLLIPAISFATETGEKKIRLTLSPSLYRGVFDAVYETDYSPANYAALPGTRAGQELSLRGAAGAGISFALVYHLNDHLGIRFSAGLSQCGIQGENSPYEVILKYTSLQPPDYLPREATHDGTMPWVPTEGKIEKMSAAVGLEIRHGFWRILQGAVSVGAGLYRIWGEFSPLGYASFWLGGHGVLNVVNDLVFLRIPAGLKAGLNLDAEISVAMGHGVFLSLRGGYDLVGGISRIPVVDRAVDYTYFTPVSDGDLTAISSLLALKEVRISPSAFSFGAGLGIGF